MSHIQVVSPAATVAYANTEPVDLDSFELEIKGDMPQKISMNRQKSKITITFDGPFFTDNVKEVVLSAWKRMVKIDK